MIPKCPPIRAVLTVDGKTYEGRVKGWPGRDAVTFKADNPLTTQVCPLDLEDFKDKNDKTMKQATPEFPDDRSKKENTGTETSKSQSVKNTNEND